MSYQYWIVIGVVALVFFVALFRASTRKKDYGGEVETDPHDSYDDYPVVNSPFYTENNYRQGARYDMDVRFRSHGSCSETPTVTGAVDPAYANKDLEYRFHCKWSVFSQSGEKINNRWVKFPVDNKGEQLALVTFFVGYEGESSDMHVPFIPRSCCPTYPGEVREDIINDCSIAEPCTFVYEVRNPAGRISFNETSLP